MKIVKLALLCVFFAMVLPHHLPAGDHFKLVEKWAHGEIVVGPIARCTKVDPFVKTKKHKS